MHCERGKYASQRRAVNSSVRLEPASISHCTCIGVVLPTPLAPKRTDLGTPRSSQQRKDNELYGLRNRLAKEDPERRIVKEGRTISKPNLHDCGEDNETLIERRSVHKMHLSPWHYSIRTLSTWIRPII